MRKEYKTPFWHKKLQEDLIEVLGKYSLLYCLSPRDLLPFLCGTLTGQFAISDYSEEFVKKTLDKIFDNFKEKRNLNQYGTEIALED